MRTLFAVALLATGVGGLFGAEVEVYTSKEGKFTAKFPSTPDVKSKTAGGLTLNIFNADFQKGKGGYLVTYSDLPPEVLKAPQKEQVLVSSEKGFVDSFKAKVTKSNALEFGPKKLPAREITAEFGEWNMRAILILVENRMYQVCVYGPKDFIANKDADAFLASFALIDAK